MKANSYTTVTWDVKQLCVVFDHCSDDDWIIQHDIPRRGCSWDYVICNDEMGKWWDIRGATKLRISLSTEPSGHAYKCKMSPNNRRELIILNEETGHWHKYGVFHTVGNVIENFSHNHEFWYLGVWVLEWK
jgi:hypothetical protein